MGAKVRISEQNTKGNDIFLTKKRFITFKKS